MSLSPVKYMILETMLFIDKPAKAMRIAKEVSKEFPSVMMHIIGLTRLGYITSPEKSLYALTERAKSVLGIPEINEEKAKKALAEMRQDHSFHFYESIGKPLGLRAHSLQDFSDKILKVNLDSIEFHESRGDFEAWFAGLGDVELSKKAALLKEKKMKGEELRSKLHEIVEKRCGVLTRMAERSFLAKSAISGA